MSVATHLTDAQARTKSTVSVPSGQGIKVEETVLINATPPELYKFWRNFENLPRFMENLESVTVKSDRLSHWAAQAAGCSLVQWDAEIINEHQNAMIAWRSLPGSELASAGSVWFEATPDGRATRVKVAFEYIPPAGKLGAAVAKFVGADPAKQVAEDLQRLKALFESGDLRASESASDTMIATTSGDSPIVL